MSKQMKFHPIRLWPRSYHATGFARRERACFHLGPPLTEYDNTDVTSGTPNSEVYLYKVGAPKPVCVSCNPTGAWPRGRLTKRNGNVALALATAASLPMADTILHTPRALSADGGRLFFESFDPLVPGDLNGAKDVYEWESAASREACAQKGAQIYVAATAGCLSLISNGESPPDSEFVDASPDGDDAFFITDAACFHRIPASMTCTTPASRRLAGTHRPEAGLPRGTSRPPAGAPNDPTPASSTYVGPGNVKQKAKKKKKPHKHRKKGSKRQHKKHAQKRRAAR